jgi:hypothetical protein
MDWNSYLKLAERLLDSAQNEADVRSATSRAYYACYNLARRYKERHGLIPPPPPKHRKSWGSHEEVWHAIKASRLPQCAVICDLGFDLRNQRNRADYDDVIPDALTEAMSALFTASTLAGYIKSLP